MTDSRLKLEHKKSQLHQSFGRRGSDATNALGMGIRRRERFLFKSWRLSQSGVALSSSVEWNALSCLNRVVHDAYTVIVYIVDI